MLKLNQEPKRLESFCYPFIREKSVMGFHNLLPQNGEAPPCPRSRKFSQILGTEPHKCTERPQASFPTSYENSESPASGMESQPSRDQSGLSIAGQSLVTFPAPQPPLLTQSICIPELTIPKICLALGSH